MNHSNFLPNPSSKLPPHKIKFKNHPRPRNSLTAKNNKSRITSENSQNLVPASPRVPSRRFESTKIINPYGPVFWYFPIRTEGPVRCGSKFARISGELMKKQAKKLSRQSKDHFILLMNSLYRGIVSLFPEDGSRFFVPFGFWTQNLQICHIFPFLKMK